MKHIMLKEKVKGVCLVFEPTYDAHIPKDVIQVPLELAKLLGDCPVYLVTRPNVCQEKLAQYLKVIHVGESIAHNNEAFLNQREEDQICSPVWQEEACRQAAKYADVLMLFPHYGNHTKCARIFWFENLLRGRFAKAFLKLDATPEKFENQEPTQGFKGKINSFRSWLKYLPIVAVSMEHDQAFKGFTRLHSELKNKCFIVKNCPPQSEIQAFNSETNIITDDKQNFFLTVGRLGSHQKATDVLLSAWILAIPHCPSWKLQLVGTCDHSFQEKWCQKLRESNVEDTVEWFGAIQDRKALWKIYRQAKVFTFPSRFESSGLVLGEAIRAECAVIATPVGDVPALLEESDPGLVPIDNPEALAEAMILFASNENVCNEQRRSIHHKIRDRQWAIQLSPVANRLKT